MRKVILYQKLLQIKGCLEDMDNVSSIGELDYARRKCNIIIDSINNEQKRINLLGILLESYKKNFMRILDEM